LKTRVAGCRALEIEDEGDRFFFFSFFPPFLSYLFLKQHLLLVFHDGLLMEHDVYKTHVPIMLNLLIGFNQISDYVFFFFRISWRFTLKPTHTHHKWSPRVIRIGDI